MSLTKEQEERMQYLVDTLQNASDAYYRGQSEVMDNYEWDALFDELKALESLTGVVLDNSPTVQVSEMPIQGIKEEHEYKALSLDKTKDIEKFIKWSEGKPCWLSMKLDGSTLVATYDDGKLTKLMTRGNGIVGTNITYLASRIENLLPEVPTMKGHCVIRGEAVISYEMFERINETLEEPYANPRNLVAGSLNLLDLDMFAERHIKWIPFTFVAGYEELTSWKDRMLFLEDVGFETVLSIPVQQEHCKSIEEGVETLTALVESGKFSYPADGLVLVYDDTEYAKTGSVTGHHMTRAGFAFKWQDEFAETPLSHIEWSCAANCITPVAVFDGVSLEGTTVKRASLANISECERLGIGDTGSMLRVIKANKIIPKVIQVTKSVGTFTIPTKCPVCGADTEVHVSESGAKTLKCVNVQCPAKQLKKFGRFVSQDGMNMKGLSEQTIKKWIAKGWVKRFPDLYHIEKHAEEMLELKGFKEKSVQNYLQMVDRARETDAKHFLYALGIPMVGHDVIARILAQDTLWELLCALSDPDKLCDDLQIIEGIGYEKAHALVSWFMEPTGENRQLVQDLLEEIRITDFDKKSVQEQVGNEFAGMTFVVTGKVAKFANRKELKAWIISHGGKVSESVTGQTAYLINNDVTSTSGKNKKAKELGVKILSEEELLQLME